jgi:hypothetical protein
MTHRNLVKHSQVGEAIGEEEQIDSTRDHRQPGPSGLPGDESLPNVEDAATPEKLAGNQHHEDGEEEQEIEGTHLAPTGGEPEGAKGDQRESGHALVSSENSDHCRCRLRVFEELASEYRLGAQTVFVA